MDNYFDLLTLFSKDKNSEEYIGELNKIIKEHNEYFKNLDADESVRLASETGITTIEDRKYDSLEDLRKGVYLFPFKKNTMDDLELLLLVLKRCKVIYSYRINSLITEYENNNFVDFINKIDIFIEKLDYDEMFKKPTIFHDYNDKAIQNYLEKKDKMIVIASNDNQLQIEKETNITSNETNEINDDGKSISFEKFLQKKKFYDLNTEFISRDNIFTDDKQQLIFKYQYLINHTFNTFISKYLKKCDLKKNSIYFVYKGGTFMKILNSKYNHLLKTNNQFLSINEDYFKRSDSDYSIFISPDFDRNEYIEHYYQMNILTYNLLNKISIFIDKNLNDLLPVNRITEESLKTQLKKINNLLLKEKENPNNIFDDIEEFIGINIYDKEYMRQEIPIGTELTSFNPNKKDSIKNKIYSNPNKKNTYKMSIKRQPFYITATKENNSYYQTLCENLDLKPLESGIYQYFNESNYYISRANKSLITYFTLHRLKLNIILYYKTKLNGYGYFICPSELIDIPINTYDDYKKNIDFKISLRTYQNILNNKKLIFNSYTLYGIIEDIYKSIFIEQKFPWNDKKYEKKIHRIFYFFIIYLNNSYTNFEDIFKTMNNYLLNHNLEQTQINLKKNDGDIINSKYDKLYTTIFKLLHQVYLNVMANPEYYDEFEKMEQIIKDKFQIFNPEKINPEYINETGIETVPYLKKYLKYKKKYLENKKNNYK